MTRMVFWIARPITLWALHFIAVYALISGACGPRALMEPDMLRVTVSFLTLVLAIVLLVFLISAGQRRRALDQSAGSAQPSEAVLAAAAYWSAAISLLAVLVNVTPVAMLGSCSG